MYTISEYSVATDDYEGYDSELAVEHVFLMPLIFLLMAVVLWCFIWTKKKDQSKRG